MKWWMIRGWMMLACVTPLAAQEEPPPQEPAAGRKVRFLPLGDMPPYRQEIRGGVAYEQEPPPGSIPPREVMIGFGEEKEDAVPLRLRTVTPPLAAPGGEGPMTVRRKDDSGETPWLKVDRPENGNFLVLLWRDPAKGGWDRGARSLVLADDKAAAPAGHVRFVNVSTVPVGVVFGKERIKLEAGKSYQPAVAPGKDHPYQLGAIDRDGGLRRFHSGAIFQHPGERSLVVIYRADGVDPRLPLKTAFHREVVE